MWLGAALALVAVEAVTVDLIFLMLALGALAGGIASYLGAGLALSSFVAAATAIAALALIRPVLRRSLRSRQSDESFGVASLIGMTALVHIAITRSGGQVIVDGDRWSARSADGYPIGAQEEVRIVHVDGATLVVEPLPHPYTS